VLSASVEASDVRNILLAHDIDATMSPAAILGLMLRGTGVSAGIAEAQHCDLPSTTRMRVRQGVTIHEAMDAFVTRNPGYQWQLDNDVINFLPRIDLPLLDTTIRSFELTTTTKVTAEAVLNELLSLPEVRQRASDLKIKPGLAQGGIGVYDEHPESNTVKPIHISIRNLSLREAFNVVVHTYGHSMWVYVEQDCAGQQTRVISVQQID